MVRRLSVALICLSLLLTMVGVRAYGAGAAEEIVGKGSGTRKQMATIIFAGLAGAILGMSTLSFYGRPQEKLANIPAGAAIGIIIGTSYTTYQAATQRRSYASADPEIWHMAEATAPKSGLPRLELEFSF